MDFRDTIDADRKSPITFRRDLLESKVARHVLAALTAATLICGMATGLRPALADPTSVLELLPSDDDFEDLADTDTAVQPVPRQVFLRIARQKMDPAGFDTIVFGMRPEASGRNSPLEAASARLRFLVSVRITTIDLACGLTAGQTRKLRLAGEGDIKRLLDRIEAQIKIWRVAQSPLPQEAQREAIEFRNALAVGPLVHDSLFVKTLDRILTAAQRARCEELGGMARLGDRIRIRSTPEGDYRIKDLLLAGAAFRDDCLERISPLTNLEGLDLERTAINGPGLAHLHGLQSLKTLNLGHTPITDEALVHVGRLAGLKKLVLEATQITGRGLEGLRPLTQLECLSLCETRVGDSGLAELGTLTNLNELDLDATHVTDAGLVHLKGLAKLRQLDLRRAHITDAGLAHLMGLTNLKYLYLYGTRVTEDGVASLQRALPGTKVIR